jgi:hypothetical protein
MRKQVLAAAATLCLVGGTSGSYAFDKDQTPWIDMILKNAEQLSKNPNFGPSRGKLTPFIPEAWQRDLGDDRLIPDLFPPTRLLFPDGTREPEPNGRYEIVRVLKVREQVLKAYAKDVPFDIQAVVKSAGVGEDTPLIDSHLLFDHRRVKEWSK